MEICIDAFVVFCRLETIYPSGQALPRMLEFILFADQDDPGYTKNDSRDLRGCDLVVIEKIPDPKQQEYRQRTRKKIRRTDIAADPISIQEPDLDAQNRGSKGKTGPVHFMELFRENNTLSKEREQHDAQ